MRLTNILIKKNVITISKTLCSPQKKLRENITRAL